MRCQDGKDKKKKKSIFLENWKIKKRVGDLFVARKHDFISCTEENSEATRNCIPRRRIMVKHAFPSYTSFMWKKEFINMGESGPTTSPHMPHTYTRTVNIYTLNIRVAKLLDQENTTLLVLRSKFNFSKRIRHY